MSARSMVKHGRRKLVIVNRAGGFCLAAATEDRRDIAPFGETHPTEDDARHRGATKFGVNPETVVVVVPEEGPNPKRMSDLYKLTVPQLREVAKQAGHRGVSRMPRSALLALLAP